MFYDMIYLFMGWIAIIPIKQMLANMSLMQEYLLFASGLFFTFVGLIYAMKNPRLISGIFSFHEFFHIMVLLGFGFRYALIYLIYFEKVA